MTPGTSSSNYAVLRRRLPDGSRLAIAGDDPYARNAMIRFMASGRSRAPAPTAADLAPRMPIHILDVTTGKELRSLIGHVHQPDALMFDRAGRLLLSATLLETPVRLWDVDTGREVRRFEQHKAGIRRAEFSADGSWVVSGDENGVIKVWGIHQGSPVDTLQFKAGHPVWAFHGSLLAVLADGRGIGVWDLRKRQWAADLGDPGRKIDAMAFVDQGRRLLSLTAQGLTLWSVDPPAEIISIPGAGWMTQDLPRISAALERLKAGP